MGMLAGPEEGRRHIPCASQGDWGLREGEKICAVTIACSSYVHLHG